MEVGKYMEPDIKDLFFCLEKDSGCFQVLSYSLGVFEEAEVSGTSTHSLCGLFIQLLLPGPVPVKDALLGRLARKPSFINNSPGETGVITDVLSGSHAAFSTYESVRKSGPGFLLAKAREPSSSVQFGYSRSIISLTSLTSREAEALLVSSVFIFHTLFLYFETVVINIHSKMLALHPQDTGGCPDAVLGLLPGGPCPHPWPLGEGLEGQGTAVALRDWSNKEQNSGQVL